MAIEILRPNANGDYAGWDFVGDSTHYLCIDDITPDGDTTYIRTSSVGKMSSFLFPISGVSGAVNSVTVKSTIRQEKTVAPWATLQLFYTAPGKVNYFNEDIITLTDSYVEYVRVYTTNPATGLAWTIDELNTMQWGFNTLADAGRYPRDTQIYIEVDCTEIGWVSPTGFIDSGNVWTDEILAYDRNASTYAYASALKLAWTDNLELTCSALDCDKVRLWVDRASTNINAMEVDVYYATGWHNIFSGAPTWGGWQEHTIGSTQSVTAMRVRFYATKATTDGCQVMEADFHEVGGVTYYHGFNVQGEGELALCDVGTNPLRVRKGGATYGLELVVTDDPNASRIRVKTGSGIRAIRKYT